MPWLPRALKHAVGTPTAPGIMLMHHSPRGKRHVSALMQPSTRLRQCKLVQLTAGSTSATAHAAGTR